MDDPRDDPCEPPEEPREEPCEPREELCDPRELLPEDREEPRDEFVRVVTLGREELPPPEKISCKRAWIAGALVEVMISIDWTLRASTISTSCSTSEKS